MNEVEWWHGEGCGMVAKWHGGMVKVVAWWHVQRADCGMSACLPPVEHTVPGHRETAEPLIVCPVSGHAAWPRILLCIRLVAHTLLQHSSLYRCTHVLHHIPVQYSAVRILLLCCIRVLFCMNLVRFGSKLDC